MKPMMTLNFVSQRQSLHNEPSSGRIILKLTSTIVQVFSDNIKFYLEKKVNISEYCVSRSAHFFLGVYM